MRLMRIINPIICSCCRACDDALFIRTRCCRVWRVAAVCVVDIFRRFRLAYRPFPEAKNEISRVVMSILSRSWYRLQKLCQTTARESTQLLRESCQMCVFLCVKLFKNMELLRSLEAEVIVIQATVDLRNATEVYVRPTLVYLRMMAVLV